MSEWLKQVHEGWGIAENIDYLENYHWLSLTSLGRWRYFIHCDSTICHGLNNLFMSLILF
jgi:hypothetical protein